MYQFYLLDKLFMLFVLELNVAPVFAYDCCQSPFIKVTSFFERYHCWSGPGWVLQENMPQKPALVLQDLTAVRTENLFGQFIKELCVMLNEVMLQFVSLQSALAHKTFVTVLTFPQNLPVKGNIFRKIYWYSPSP